MELRLQQRRKTVEAGFEPSVPRDTTKVYRALGGREGLGGGDAKLLAASGAWLGAAALPEVILLAALSALAAAACLRLAGIRLGIHSALPFGPFLALAIWVLWLLCPID